MDFIEKYFNEMNEIDKKDGNIIREFIKELVEISNKHSERVKQLESELLKSRDRLKKLEEQTIINRKRINSFRNNIDIL